MRKKIKTLTAFALLLGISLVNYQSNAVCLRNPRLDDGQCKVWEDGTAICLFKYDNDFELDCIRE